MMKPSKGQVAADIPKLDRPPVQGVDYPADAPTVGPAPKGYRWCMVDPRFLKSGAPPDYCLTDALAGECACKAVKGWWGKKKAELGYRGIVFQDLTFQYGALPIVWPKAPGEDRLCAKARSHTNNYYYYSEQYAEIRAYSCDEPDKKVQADRLRVSWRFEGEEYKHLECRNTDICTYGERLYGPGASKTIQCSAGTVYGPNQRAGASTNPYYCP
ncbi:hypothetical protein [Cupriavidus malaysiensis]|uniref:hypothetical protein n=1 Tax=Cupriavidus malaysiensis TaxID=367825 RepID=UPI0012FF7383|nr:hypothetical protein [Cupriavidus malaysiensis]